MRHLRRKRRIPSSKLHGVSRNQTHWQVIKSCQLNVLLSVYLLSHIHADIFASARLKIRLNDCQIMQTMQGNRECECVSSCSRDVSPVIWWRMRLFRKSPYVLCFSCHILFKVPFVPQICLLHELPFICENANAQIPILIQDVASRKQPPTR